MFRTRVTSITLALMLGIAAIAGAQQPGRDQRPGREQMRPMAFLFRGITLTDQQEAKLQDLRKEQAEKAKDNREDFQKYREEMQEARAKGDTAKVREIRAKGRDEMRERRDHMIKEVREILTPDQQKIFDQNVADARARMEQGRESFNRGGQRFQGFARQPGMRGAALRSLNLTEQQKDQIRAILTPEQRAIFDRHFGGKRGS